MAEEQSMGRSADGAAIDALIASGDWAGALAYAKTLAEAAGVIDPLIALAQRAREASQMTALADTLFVAVQFPASPDQGHCQAAVLVNYELGRLEEADIAGRIGRAAFPDDPILAAYGSLAAAQRQPQPDAVAAVRAAFIASPALYGSFYAGYAQLMVGLGFIDEAAADLSQALAATEQNPQVRTSALGIKATLFQILYDHGRFDRALPLLFGLLDANIQHLQAEYERKAVDFLIQQRGDEGTLSTYREPAYRAWSFLKALLSGQAIAGQTAPSVSALTYLAAKSLRYVEMGEVDTAAIAPAIAPGFLRIAAQGPAALARQLRVGRAPHPWHDDPILSDRIKDILDTVNGRAKQVLSPFTGTAVTTAHMVDEECFLLNEDGRIALVAQWVETDVTLADTIYILPDQGVVLYSKETNLAPETIAKKILATLKGLAARPDDVTRLVKDARLAIGIAEFMCPHIGHYIWNCISGWDPFFAHGGGAKADFYAVQRHCQTLGSVGTLYADYVGGPDRLALIDEQNTPQAIMLDRHAMLLTIKHDHVSEGLARRVVAWAYDRIAPERLEAIRQFRAASSMLCLVTLRLDNRCWVDQQNGWPALMCALSERYPEIGFILDGINCDNVQGWTHGFMSAAPEAMLARHIIEQCPGVRIHDAINCTLAESFVLGDVADFFIAPVGAGMAKSRWISNLPGVAFSNRSFSLPTSRDGRLYDSYRDDARKAVHVPSEKITDVEAGHATGFRANFRLDWQDLLPLVIDQCEAIRAASAGAPLTRW